MELKEIIKFILSRLTNTTAWIGLIGMGLFVFNFHFLLFALFVALFLFPEKDFGDVFTKWTAWLTKKAD